MKIDIQIDSLTPCLIERKTGNPVDTVVKAIKPAKNDYKSWNFDWSIPLRNNYDVYALRVRGSTQIQGMIAIAVDDANAAMNDNRRRKLYKSD
ncbi:MAG: hypothetical protein FWD48_11815 [Oscillospiraceae bacterium]|nr:hypothetical protein [Oscillospiraceae bacterium]